MRGSTLVLALTLVSGSDTCRHAKPNATAPTASTVSAHKKLAAPASSMTVAAKVDFATQVRPIFESRCNPCHFKGGTMYERLPFDQPETIKALGTKLFSRIKNEDEQRLIRKFLSQQPERGHARH
jgi:hypothetical protein